MYQRSQHTVTYDNALATLHSMFSDYDRETLAVILESNNFHVEKTIECILAMSDPGSSTNNTTTNNSYNDSTNNNRNNSNNYDKQNDLTHNQNMYTSTPSNASKRVIFRIYFLYYYLFIVILLDFQMEINIVEPNVNYLMIF